MKLAESMTFSADGMDIEVSTIIHDMHICW